MRIERNLHVEVLSVTKYRKHAADELLPMSEDSPMMKKRINITSTINVTIHIHACMHTMAGYIY